MGQGDYSESNPCADDEVAPLVMRTKISINCYYELSGDGSGHELLLSVTEERINKLASTSLASNCWEQLKTSAFKACAKYC